MQIKIFLLIIIIINMILVFSIDEGIFYNYWKKDHYDCFTEIKMSDFNKDDISIITNGNGFVTSKITCSEASYMEYVRMQYNQSNNEFTKSILLSIINLYKDLHNSRQPASIQVEGLENNSTVLIYPISFAIPEQYVIKTIPPKTKAFGRVVPGDTSTYYNMYQENEYRQDMSDSLFVLTYKKGGWDCLRHYEILASGAIPLFLEIDQSPNVALTAHPKKLYERILHWPGLVINASRSETNHHLMNITSQSFDMSLLDRKLYMAVSAALRQYTLNVLTTKVMAKYLIETIRKYQMIQLGSQIPLPKNILYLTHYDKDMNKGDYLTDMMAHGLKELLGDSVVTDFPKRYPLYKSDKDFNKTEYFVHRETLYGFGFSWGHTIDDWETTERNYGKIDSNIEANVYDLIIIGSGHRDGWKSMLNFRESICKYYKPYQIALIDGSDHHLKVNTIKRYSSCVGIIFSREGCCSFYK